MAAVGIVCLDHFFVFTHAPTDLIRSLPSESVKKNEPLAPTLYFYKEIINPCLFVPSPPSHFSATIFRPLLAAVFPFLVSLHEVGYAHCHSFPPYVNKTLWWHSAGFPTNPLFIWRRFIWRRRWQVCVELNDTQLVTKQSPFPLLFFFYWLNYSGWNDSFAD